MADADWLGCPLVVAVTVIRCVLVTEPGAVYNPELEMLPTLGLMDQVTLPADAGIMTEELTENCWLCAGTSVTEPGVIDRPGIRVTVADPDLVGSAALVAVTVTVCCALMEEGAVYKPPVEMLPVPGVTDQVTAWLLEPVTVAVNCCA